MPYPRWYHLGGFYERRTTSDLAGRIAGTGVFAKDEFGRPYRATDQDMIGLARWASLVDPDVGSPALAGRARIILSVARFIRSEDASPKLVR